MIIGANTETWITATRRRIPDRETGEALSTKRDDLDFIRTAALSRVDRTEAVLYAALASVGVATRPPVGPGDLRQVGDRQITLAEITWNSAIRSLASASLLRV